eukprot:TRINITY_DN3502_c0_g1_i1.p1 TRINITY_DN3502_c0_g1~~TRINITY_DN3502_c0_g1_i1.p1  ORF type:complete len:122 (+),score=17.44 TRINITY_DN3502_c0_g1_i1:79-444(+)
MHYSKTTELVGRKMNQMTAVQYSPMHNYCDFAPQKKAKKVAKTEDGCANKKKRKRNSTPETPRWLLEIDEINKGLSVADHYDFFLIEMANAGTLQEKLGVHWYKKAVERLKVIYPEWQEKS